MEIKKRLPKVNSLSSLIPSGAEGGKEFSRIVDLLLFQDYRRKGKDITIFNDSAGDYKALDSFERKGAKGKKYIGYQYKFYSSPLSQSHRTNIIESLKHAKLKHEKKELLKWILVTPDDLTESAVKTNKGDVSWFNNLRADLSLDFEVEHWGHTKIIALFIETPSLCLFYYPELVSNGYKSKKTIEDTKYRYDQNLLGLYKNIEFVGMSIYKPEATKGIPMEHIYIPLNVIPESSDDQTATFNSIDPLNFLSAGSRTVILGDPGSGKSTLLKFLSLSGISDALQKRYKTKLDIRLSIFIILRKYADELKSRTNLSLIDYLQEQVQAAFNLKSFDLEFLEYYLETGQAVILFDGLDELPDSNFKLTVRERIQSLITTYPGNTIIVTSRIVGYNNPIRFDENEFNHYKVAKLQIPEMECGCCRTLGKQKILGIGRRQPAEIFIYII